MFNAYQLEQLAKRGITQEIAQAAGVTSVRTPEDLPEQCPDYWRVDNNYLPGMLFPWVAVDGRVEYQLRPDNPPLDEEGKPKKYTTRSKESGYEPVLWVAKRGSEDGPVLIVEGTCQTVAAGAYAPEGTWVVGMFGCHGWSSDHVPVPDLDIVHGRHVVAAFDADMATNRSVWDAAQKLQEALRAEGAASVKFLKTPTGGKAGLDDYLGSRAADRRASTLATLINRAEPEKFPTSRQPKAKRGSDSKAAELFGDDGILAKKVSELVRETYPMMLTRERTIAVYRHGVYKRDDLAFTGLMSEMLGDRFRPNHRATVSEFTAGTLFNENAQLPDYMDEPLLNCTNGMVNLLTGELLPHDPKYPSSSQIPIEWDTYAKCPNYEKWLEEVAPGQVDDLEETVSLMLDPSRTPTKSVFLFGPTRSGKSTFLRLMQRIVGVGNYSSVTPHQLAENKFMAANVYGMMLNVAADISSADLKDVSIFKMMSGEDPIEADRKHGAQFSFVNRALFAWSANNPPTVGEASNAYFARIKPIWFPNSFEGREDPDIEKKMVAELPGILVRWVRAYGRLSDRGHVLPTDVSAKREFERQSDRVRQFVEECCDVVPSDSAPLSNWDAAMASATDLAKAFRAWAESTNGSTMGRNNLVGRISLMDGVVRVREKGAKRRDGFNLRIRPESDWGYTETEEVEKTATAPTDEFVPDVVPSSNGHVPAAAPLPNGCAPAVAAVLALAVRIPDEAIRCKKCGFRQEHVPTEAGEINCPHCFPEDFAWTMEDPMGVTYKSRPDTSWPGRRCHCPDCPGGGKLSSELIGKKIWDEEKQRWT